MSKSGRDPRHDVGDRTSSPSSPVPDAEVLTDSTASSRPETPRRRLYLMDLPIEELERLRATMYVSPRERADEQRRHRDEFDEPGGFFCDDPFGAWIQTILDEDRGPQ